MSKAEVLSLLSDFWTLVEAHPAAMGTLIAVVMLVIAAGCMWIGRPR